jgi:hypothetical protein
MPHDGSGWLDDWRAIQVDIGSVQQLATNLVTEVKGNLEPNVDRVYAGYASGTTFGGKSPSLELQAIRQKYDDCLKATVAQLAAYVEASSILVAAAVEIAFRYRTTDELAAASMADIDGVLSDAVQAVQSSVDFGHDVGAAPQDRAE